MREFDAKTWAQFCVKYVISHPAVTAARTGTTKPAHMLDNIGGGIGRLPNEAMRSGGCEGASVSHRQRSLEAIMRSDMRVRSFVFVGSLTLLTVALCGAAAVLASPVVQQGQAVQPGPMPADHPVAKRAAAVVEPIVAGNRDAAIAAMKKEGTAELAASPRLELQVDGHMKVLAKKGYKIREFTVGGSSNVVVRLAGESGDVTVEILFSAEAPHQLRGLGRVMLVR